MSALGQKRTFSGRAAMSALPSKADILHCNRTPLFDYLVGSGEYLLRNREAKLPRGLYIDNEMELHGLFDRKYEHEHRSTG